MLDWLFDLLSRKRTSLFELQLTANWSYGLVGRSRVRTLESEFPAEHLARITCGTSIWRRVGHRCQQRTMSCGKALQSLVTLGIVNKPVERLLLWRVAATRAGGLERSPFWSMLAAMPMPARIWLLSPGCHCESVAALTFCTWCISLTVTILLGYFRNGDDKFRANEKLLMSRTWARTKIVII